MPCMAVKIQTIVDYVFEIAPNPSFGNENIYEFGNGDAEVNAVGIAWWITSAMLEDFARRGITLGLTHERTVYDTDTAFKWGKACATDELEVNRRFAALVAEHGITIHRFHSNLDVAPWGMPHALLEQLGWSDYPADWSRGVPVIEHPPVTFGELIDEVKSRMGLPFARYDGDVSRTVSRIALPWGGICQWWNGAAAAAPLGFDVMIGGDVIDGVVRLAREQNWCVIDAFHHATEMPAMQRLGEKLRERFTDLDVRYYENTMPWAVR